jgi:putative ABC transport system permease protein
MGQGRFISEVDLNRRSLSAVLGATLAERLFDQESPIGQSIRIKGVSFEVIGVMAQKGSNLGLDYDDAVIVPITTQASRLVGQRQSPYGIQVSFIVRLDRLIARAWTGRNSRLRTCCGCATTSWRTTTFL